MSETPDAGSTAPRDDSARLRERVCDAHAAQRPLRVRGGGTKDFYGRDSEGSDVLDTTQHGGIVSYEPSELVLTVRAGTALTVIDEALAGGAQMLPFEPPAFGEGATIGGTVACGLSGPRRAAAGACRDFVLGVRVITGTGEILSFGGQVMKNVAGYDVSRLMTGAFGTLGVLLDVSFKVLPRPEAEHTVVFECSAPQAVARLAALGRQALGVSAACWDGQRLRVRLSGNERGVRAAHAAIGGDVDIDGAAFWEALREHRLAWFDDARPLWRLALPPATPVSSALSGDWLIDWEGSQRWLLTEEAPERVFDAARASGGHALLFRASRREGVFMDALDPVTARLHRRLKQAFDPGGILNPGRIYPDW